MVDMMQADITGEPLQHFRQFIVRTALQRCPDRVPLLMTCPIDSLILVLDIEQPDAEGSCEAHDGYLNQKVGAQTDSKVRHSEDSQKRQIGQGHAVAFFLRRSLARE